VRSALFRTKLAMAFAERAKVMRERDPKSRLPHQKEPVPSILQRINRLYNHWKDDPYKMTPPPTRMPPSVRDFLKLRLASAGTVLENDNKAQTTSLGTPGPESMRYPPNHPGTVYYNKSAKKDVWCPIVGRSS
jgi:hypothetical protein